MKNTKVLIDFKDLREKAEKDSQETTGSINLNAWVRILVKSFKK
tara:strand:- start:997 stop:1128 length:132 start_codon:yes stop_codon:yes gene_type:complete